MAWRATPHVAWQVVGDEAIVLDLETGHALGLNATGTRIWQLAADHDVDSIARRIASEFAIDETEARRDVAEFLARMGVRRLLESSG